MRLSSARVGIALLTVAAVAFAACSTSGSSPGASGGSALKIGLVTDVGTLNDKNFNQFSWEGTVDGATKIGARRPSRR